MHKHFVRFYSPGTFVAEMTDQEIGSWDVEAAVVRAAAVTERYGATPFSFQFLTRERGIDDFDSREIARSPTYYLGGTIWTLADLKAKNDPEDTILIRNMEINQWDRVIINTNSWQWIQPFRETDILLEWP
jgi:hypothetical protein